MIWKTVSKCVCHMWQCIIPTTSSSVVVSRDHWNRLHVIFYDHLTHLVDRYMCHKILALCSCSLKSGFRSQNSWVIHRFTDCGLSPNVIFWLNVESIMGNACNKRRCLPWLRRIHSCSFWRSLISSDVFLDYDRLSVL